MDDNELFSRALATIVSRQGDMLLPCSTSCVVGSKPGACMLGICDRLSNPCAIDSSSVMI